MEHMQNTPPGTAGPPAVPQPSPGLPRSPWDRGGHLQVPLSPRTGTSISPPAPGGAGEPAPPARGGVGVRGGRGIARFVGRPPLGAVPGLVAPFPGVGEFGGGYGGVLLPFPPPSPPLSPPFFPHTPSPIPTLPLQRGLRFLPAPFSSLPAQEFSHHPLAEGMSSPHPIPSHPGTEVPSPGPALQPFPGSPGSPGTPIPARDALSPAWGEIGVCTHPLPAAAVALSLETGSDSGSITFSALSLSGNFCSNPSEKGGQAGLWVHPSQELCSLPL